MSKVYTAYVRKARYTMQTLFTFECPEPWINHCDSFRDHILSSASFLPPLWLYELCSEFAKLMPLFSILFFMIWTLTRRKLWYLKDSHTVLLKQSVRKIVSWNNFDRLHSKIESFLFCYGAHNIKCWWIGHIDASIKSVIDKSAYSRCSNLFNTPHLWNSASLLMKMDECSLVSSISHQTKVGHFQSLWLCAYVCSFIEMIPHIFRSPVRISQNNTHITRGNHWMFYGVGNCKRVDSAAQNGINEKKREIYQFQFEFQTEKPFPSIHGHTIRIFACAFFALLSDSKSLLYSYAILEFYFSFNFDLGCSIEESHKSHMQQVFEWAKIRWCRFVFFFLSLSLSFA